MPGFEINGFTESVLAQLANAGDPRLRTVMTSLVRHLHAFVREARPTEAEWLKAVDFLTRTGQACTDRRQEFILLSDLLGVSMLVDAINHPTEGAETESTVLGPFYVEGAPELESGASIARSDRTDPTLVRLRVAEPGGRGIAGATVDVWQTGSDATYDVQRPDLEGMDMRGRFRTDGEGRLAFRTVRPRSYPVPTDGPCGEMLRAVGRHARRPAHIHFMIAAPGYERLVTHLFVEGDPYLASDAVFGVKPSLVVPFVRHEDAAEAARLGMPAPCYTLDYDFVLKPAGAPDRRGEALWSARA